MKAAIATIHRISQPKQRRGWCKADPETGEVPVTLNTNLPPAGVVSLAANLDTLHTDSFDDVDVTPSSSSQWDRSGPFMYRWYHCQVFGHAHHNLMIYLDADATVCSGADLQSFFSDAEKLKWDQAFEDSQWLRGYGMSEGNKLDSHPPTVQSKQD